MLKNIVGLLVAFTFSVTAGTAHATLIEFTQEFTSGFNVSVNGGAPAPSGPITITGIVDDTATDIDLSGSRGEFVPVSVTFTGAGFVDEVVTTALGLLIWGTDKFAFQLQGQFNVGITGWNSNTSSGSFITDVNDLTTLLATPYATTGASTFWWQSVGNEWTLASGDTIGANPDVGGGGPDGIFSIQTAAVPEPATLALFGLGLAGLGWSRRKKA